MISLAATPLEGHGIRLEPLSPSHEPELRAAAADGALWTLWYTSVPEPGETGRYIDDALAGRDAGHMLPWAIRELTSGAVVGTTRYHDVIASARRVEIGYTWYAARWQRSHVNTAAKLMLLEHAFETVGCAVVGFRTDNFNFRSQRAIEALGAKRDGVLRHHHARRDGTVRDTVMYSILAAEWPDVKRHLTARLARLAGNHESASDRPTENVDERRRIEAKGPWSATVGYSRAIRVGSSIHVAGTAAVQPDGTVGPIGDVYGQAQRCLSIITGALAELGATPAHVVRTRVFVKDPAHWEQVGRAHAEVFASLRPVSTMVFTSFIHPDMLVEIEAEAML